MVITDKSLVRNFVLLRGTDDKVEFKWPTGAHPIGPWTEQVDATLLQLREVFARNPGTAASCVIVDGIRLAWCFTALEVERLQAENDALLDKIGDLTKRFDQWEHTLIQQSAAEEP